jgi:hypothetical protein
MGRDDRSPSLHISWLYGVHGAVTSADRGHWYSFVVNHSTTILVLHHVERRSVVDIAAVLGIPEGTAKWRLHAARGALERALREEAR